MTPEPLDRRLCVAPMMDRTDRHDRFFLRRLTRRALLYTEMIPTGALLRGDAARHLRFDPCEHPVALQLGGGDPGELARAAELAAEWGYDEANLNAGCPSARVRDRRIGACLMAEPELVAACVRAMAAASGLPVTVKTRIGIDDRDDYGFLLRFVDAAAAAGCRTFIVHARKAVLSGLTPKQNREIPPLDHARVHRLKRDRPELEIVINGGVSALEEARAHLRHVDGVMIGRAAYENPYMLAAADREIFGDAAARPPRRRAAAEAMIPYAMREAARGVPLNGVARHMLGLFRGRRGGRAWRRHLSQHAPRPGADANVLRAALTLVGDEAAENPPRGCEGRADAVNYGDTHAAAALDAGAGAAR